MVLEIIKILMRKYITCKFIFVSAMKFAFSSNINSFKILHLYHHYEWIYFIVSLYVTTFNATENSSK